MSVVSASKLFISLFSELQDVISDIHCGVCRRQTSDKVLRGYVCNCQDLKVMRDCLDYYHNGFRVNGIYKIHQNHRKVCMYTSLRMRVCVRVIYLNLYSVPQRILKQKEYLFWGTLYRQVLKDVNELKYVRQLRLGIQFSGLCNLCDIINETSVCGDPSIEKWSRSGPIPFARYIHINQYGIPHQHQQNRVFSCCFFLLFFRVYTNRIYGHRVMWW